MARSTVYCVRYLHNKCNHIMRSLRHETDFGLFTFSSNPLFYPPEKCTVQFNFVCDNTLNKSVYYQRSITKIRR